MVLAEYGLGEALLTTLAIFFFVIWVWIVITILMDLFRDHELSGWWKAVWVIFLIFIPILTSLVYLIVRGSGMRERAIKEQADSKKQFDEYVRETAGSTPVDELHKLDQLRQSGGITAEEYEKMKADLIK